MPGVRRVLRRAGGLQNVFTGAYPEGGQTPLEPAYEAARDTKPSRLLATGTVRGHSQRQAHSRVRNAAKRPGLAAGQVAAASVNRPVARRGPLQADATAGRLAARPRDAGVMPRPRPAPCNWHPAAGSSSKALLAAAHDLYCSGISVPLLSVTHGKPDAVKR